MEKMGISPEQAPSEAPISIPESLAKGFTDGSIVDQSTLLSESEISDLYQCLEHEMHLPGIDEETSFRIEYLDFHDPETETFRQMRFAYIRKEGDLEFPIAQMWLTASNEKDSEHPHDLNLVHREVDTAHRSKKGIGTSLYHQAEGWARQLAAVQHEAVTIAAAAGQADVLAWLTKLGYSPYPDDQATYDEWIAHPEKFRTATLDQGVNDFGVHIYRENAVYRKDTDEAVPIRIWMRKTIAPE